MLLLRCRSAQLVSTVTRDSCICTFSCSSCDILQLQSSQLLGSAEFQARWPQTTRGRSCTETSEPLQESDAAARLLSVRPDLPRDAVQDRNRVVMSLWIPLRSFLFCLWPKDLFWVLISPLLKYYLRNFKARQNKLILTCLQELLLSKSGSAVSFMEGKIDVSCSSHSMDVERMQDYFSFGFQFKPLYIHFFQYW